MDSPHKGIVMRKAFRCHDFTMNIARMLLRNSSRNIDILKKYIFLKKKNVFFVSFFIECYWASRLYDTVGILIYTLA